MCHECHKLYVHCATAYRLSNDLTELSWEMKLLKLFGLGHVNPSPEIHAQRVILHAAITAYDCYRKN